MTKKAVLCDMDGVIIWDNQLISGAKTFIDRLTDEGHPFLFITNYPSLTPADLHHRLKTAGVTVSPITSILQPWRPRIS